MSHTPWPTDWPSITLKTADAQCTILHYGAHVVSCKLRGTQEIFWLSEASDFEQGKPIRGGIPLCWPNFGDSEDYPTFPKHGFARLGMWEKVSEQSSAEKATAVLKIASKDMHCNDLNPNLVLQFHIELTNDTLSTTLEVCNNGSEDFCFTESQHAYFAISDIDQVSVSGMKGQAYIDRLNNSKEEKHDKDLFRISQPTDIILAHHQGALDLKDEGLKRTIHVAKQGSQCSVVWNPYQAMPPAITDMAADAFRSFLCIEPANPQLTPVMLKPGASSRLKMEISVSSL